MAHYERSPRPNTRPPAAGQTPTRSLAIALLAIALLAACSSGAGPISTPALSTAATSPAAAATPTREPASPLPPAIAEALQDVAQIRDLSPPPDLRVNVIPRSELPDLLDSLITDEDRELYHNTTTLYRLLGHFTDDQDYLSLYTAFGATGILGLYSPLDDELWVVSDAGTDALQDLSPVERETLAHELVHALQDYHFSLDEVLRGVEDNLDRTLAYIAAVEGDAVVHERLYSDQYLLLPLAGRLWLLGTTSAPPATIPTSFIRELLFPYTSGADFVRLVRLRRGTAAIDEYLRTPPSSTSVILHPDLETNGFRPEPVQLPRLEAALGTAWQWESGGSLGEFHLGNYLQLGLSDTAAREAAKGWIGDHYDVYTEEGGSVAVFHLRFASAAEAGEFADAHLGMLESRSASSELMGTTSIFAMAEGKWTAVIASAGTDVLFAAATSRDSALHALELIGGS